MHPRCFRELCDCRPLEAHLRFPTVLLSGKPSIWSTVSQVGSGLCKNACAIMRWTVWYTALHSGRHSSTYSYPRVPFRTFRVRAVRAFLTRPWLETRYGLWVLGAMAQNSIRSYSSPRQFGIRIGRTQLYNVLVIKTPPVERRRINVQHDASTRQGLAAGRGHPGASLGSIHRWAGSHVRACEVSALPPQSREGLAGALRAVGMLARAGGVRDAAGRASPLKHAGIPFVQGADGLGGSAGGGFSSPKAAVQPIRVGRGPEVGSFASSSKLRLRDRKSRPHSRKRSLLE